MKDYVSQNFIGKKRQLINRLTVVAILIALIFFILALTNIEGNACFEYIQGYGCV